MRRVRLGCGLVVVAVGLALCGALATHMGQYLLWQGVYQAKLLWGAMPTEQAIKQGYLTEAERDKLVMVERIRAFGQRIGLKPSDSYRTIHPTWDVTLYNVSACNPVAFESVTWWFPIVGTVPYLGFFREQDAKQTADELRAQGLDVYLRTAGAYSTLGWANDPLLPSMLRWSEASLASTLLHELVHATVWIPGSVSFNESFAQFVGNKAALQYLEHTYGKHSSPVQRALDRAYDRKIYRRVLHGVYNDLNEIYDSNLTKPQKLAAKQHIIAGIPQRLSQAPFVDPNRYKNQKKHWNNARISQFKTYNSGQPHFETLLAQHGGDLLAFMRHVQQLTAHTTNPLQAIRAAAAEE